MAGFCVLNAAVSRGWEVMFMRVTMGLGVRNEHTGAFHLLSSETRSAVSIPALAASLVGGDF